MELYKEILAKALEKEDFQITFPDLKLDGERIIELKCYQALRQIKAIIADDSLEDRECFMKIEKIIGVLEGLGSNGGNRHDFG